MCGDNMHSVECGPTGRCASYTVCQHTVWAYKSNRLKGFEDCRSAIDARTCPAIKMMLAEKKAGKALYFDSYAEILKARQDRLDQIEAESAALKRRSRKSLITSKAVDPNRDAEIAAAWEEADDTVEKRLAKRRNAKPELIPANENLFEAVVNELAAKEASAG